MDLLDIRVFSSTLAITLLMLGIFVFTQKGIKRKLTYVFATLTVFVYSGIGVALEHVDDAYMWKYAISLLVLLGAIKIVYIIRPLKEDAPDSKLNVEILRYETLYTWLTVVYFITLSVCLVYPQFRLRDVIMPPSLSIEGYFAKKEAMSSNTVLEICSLLRVMFQPFFFLKVYCLLKKKKKVIISLLFAAWMYLSYLEYCYISRYQILVFLAFFALILFCTKDCTLKITLKHVAVFCLVIALMLPFLAKFSDTRQGKQAEDLTIKESLYELIETECNYPEYYDMVSNSSDEITPKQLFSWILFLPIPSVIYPDKPTLSINKVFTYLVTKMQPGDPGYSILLPSFIGESLLIWGTEYYWVHALIVGLFIGIFQCLFEKYRSLYVVNIYFIIQILLLGRGGVSSFLPALINGSILLFVWLILLIAISRQKEKDRMNLLDKREI